MAGSGRSPGVSWPGLGNAVGFGLVSGCDGPGLRNLRGDAVGCFWWVSARYEEDFLPALMLLAVLGVLGLERVLAENRARRLAARWGWGSLLVLSIAFNVVASFQHRAEQYYDHAKMMLVLGRCPEAIADFKEALKIRPDYTDASLGLAEAHEQAGGNAEAIGELKDILRRNPDNADVENRPGAFPCKQWPK